MDISTKISLSFSITEQLQADATSKSTNIVSGYVTKGGLTGVLGCSSSASTFLLSSLSRQRTSAHYCRHVLSKHKFIEIWEYDPRSNGCNVCFTDFAKVTICEELSLLEHLIFKSKVRPVENIILIEIVDILELFKLSSVSNKPIKYLSNEMKSRALICIELYNSSPIMLMHEPTSGLDSFQCLDILKGIKELTTVDNNQLSVMLSIQQPTYQLLELFDNILMLGADGNMIHFGTVPDSISYFSEIGYPPPNIYTSVEYFLQICDSNVTEAAYKLDFNSVFLASEQYKKVSTVIQNINNDHLKSKLNSKIENVQLTSQSSWNIMKYGMQWCRQYNALLIRNCIEAVRDISCYYVQFFFSIYGGLAIGLTFYGSSYDIGNKSYIVLYCTQWLAIISVFVPVFRAFHMHRSLRHLRHERSHHLYSITAYWFAEFTCEALFSCVNLVNPIIAHIVLRFSLKSLPFMVLLCWLIILSTSSVLHVLVILCRHFVTAFVLAQLVLLTYCLFCSCFYRFDQIPVAWSPIAFVSIHGQAGKASAINIFRYVDFDCTLASDGVCRGVMGQIYKCASNTTVTVTAGKCVVSGSQYLLTEEGLREDDSPWKYIANLIYVMLFLRILSLIMLCYLDSMGNINTFLNDIFDNTSRNLDRKALKELHASFMRKGKSVYNLFPSSAEIGKNITRKEREVKDSDDDEENGVAKIFPKKDVEYSYSKGVGVRKDVIVHQLGITASKTIVENRMSSSLTWRSVNVYINERSSSNMFGKHKKKVIENLSGIVRSGSTLAIMGPSGSGSTMLLNALCGRATKAVVQGDIRYCGRPLTSSDLVFVPKLNILNKNLTVMEQIYMIGSLKCKDLQSMKNTIMNLFVLLKLKHMKDTMCKYLTKGEKRLVSICMGMVSNPNILFLDEPTADLDASIAGSTVSLLTSLAKSTKVAVIMTIKRPSSLVFSMLENLYLIESGRLAFFGPAADAQRFFSTLGYQCPDSISAADFYIDLIYSYPTEDPSITWKALYLTFNISALITAKDGVEELHGEGLDVMTPNKWLQFKRLVIYFLIYYSREVKLFGFRLTFAIISAIINGTYFNHVSDEAFHAPVFGGAVMCQIMMCCFIPTTTTSIMVIECRDALEKAMNGVISAEIYSLAQFVASIPFYFTLSVFYALIFFGLSGITNEVIVYLYAVAMHCLHFMLVDSIMMIIVLKLKHEIICVSVSVAMVGAFLLLTGYFIAVDHMPIWLRWLCYLNPTKYSFDGYIHILIRNRLFRFLLEDQENGYVTGDYILHHVFIQSNVNPWFMMVVLLSWMISFRVIWIVLFSLEVSPLTHRKRSVKINKRKKSNIRISPSN